jgi:hypothetical protein
MCNGGVSARAMVVYALQEALLCKLNDFALVVLATSTAQFNNSWWRLVYKTACAASTAASAKLTVPQV